MRGILMKNPQRITKYIANVYIKYMFICNSSTNALTTPCADPEIFPGGGAEAYFW